VSERVEVPAALAGERVDRAVAFLSGRSRAEVSELIATGAVRVGGIPVMARHRKVAAGEFLEFDLAVIAAPVALAASAAIEFTVVYEDESLAVIDKPAGLVVHPGAAHRDDTLAAGLLHRYPDLAAAALAGAGGPERPGIVHRLDKETSGLLVIARTPAAHAALSEALAAREIGRRYLALTLGAFEADEGIVDAPIGRSKRDPTRMAVVVGGRAARTRYEVLRRFADPLACTFVRCTLESGRTHQIRVHLRAIGHSVAGDRRYGGSAPALGLARPFLHAAELEFTHPVSGERLQFSSALPEDLRALLERLEALNA
jgi:23S rRNA pseudouridine1911/1915/1917 synthase